MPEVEFNDPSVSLHKKLSIGVPQCSENLVGNVILEKKPCALIMSKYSLNTGFSLIFSKSILKSSAMITSLFDFCK